MNTKPFLIMIFVLSLMCVGLIIPFQTTPAASNVTQDQDDEIEASSRKQFMRGKLASNQKIVEGLSLKDYDLIREGAKDVTAVVKGQHWFVLKTPEYTEYSKDMEKAAQLLGKAAEDRNLEAAALRYFEVTMTCIDCHRYLEERAQ